MLQSNAHFEWLRWGKRARAIPAAAAAGVYEWMGINVNVCVCLWRVQPSYYYIPFCGRMSECRIYFLVFFNKRRSIYDRILKHCVLCGLIFLNIGISIIRLGMGCAAFCHRLFVTRKICPRFEDTGGDIYNVLERLLHAIHEIALFH